MNIDIELVPPATKTATNSTAPQAKSWRDVLPIHPAAERFPLMSPDELAALGEDIGKHGLRSSIVLWSDGKSPALLLDGRSRLDAIEIEIGSGNCRRAERYGRQGLSRRQQGDRVRPLGRSLRLRHQRQHPPPPPHRRAEARADRQADQGRSREVGPADRGDGEGDHKTVATVRAEKEGLGTFPSRTTDRQQGPPAARAEAHAEAAPSFGGDEEHRDVAAEGIADHRRQAARSNHLASPPPTPPPRRHRPRQQRRNRARMHARIEELQADKRRT